jgi:type IX secretion system PorP/SprF family membrane protein
VKKKLIILTVFLVGGQWVWGQQIGQYTQYMSNELVINPAFAGAHEVLSLTMVHRSQWTGLEGAPSTQTFSAHSLFKSDHFGLGITVVNDRVGIHQNLTFNTSYAYHLQIDKDTYFSMGLQVGVNHKQSDFGSLIGQTQTPNDPSISAFGATTTSLEVGTGIYFRSPKLHLGLSAPKLFSSKTSMNDSINIELNKPHYFLYGRYRVPINSNIKIQPGILIKYLPNIPVSFDFSLAAIFNEVLLTGLSYRSFESIDLLLQAKVTKQLKLGYSFDYPISMVSELSRSSHEIMLNYIFRFSKYKIKPPR